MKLFIFVMIILDLRNKIKEQFIIVVNSLITNQNPNVGALN